MTKNYTSPSTGEPCTAASLIAELMVKREAEKKGKILPHKFWNTPEWKKKFLKQLYAANALLKVYEPLAILNAINSKEGSWQLSLHMNQLKDVVKQKQLELDKIKENLLAEEKSFNEEVIVKQRPSVGTKSKRSKLD